MRYNVLVSFAGTKLCGTKGSVVDIEDASLAKELLEAKYIEEQKEEKKKKNK